MKRVTVFLLLILSLVSCNKSADEGNGNGPLFKLLPSENTGVIFQNTIKETWFNNYFNYIYFYNGAGVAVGDINNDGLPDLYFAGNMVPNKLYLNKGDLKFEDITQSAGLFGDDRWITGVTMVDVNGDGYLDIYVCVSGTEKGQRRANQLYINNGDMSFSEKAAEYGLDATSASTQAYFFDYDLDGDLDLYLLNHPVNNKISNDVIAAKTENPDPQDSDRFYRNDNGVFTDISEGAGIVNYGYGLSAMILDYNNDGWPDIYIANDFNTPDFLYLNNKNGTFSNKLTEVVRHTSNFSMGSDAADFNNDGLVDMLVLDMMPESSRRKKISMPGMNKQQLKSTVDYGFHYQYLKNTLQLNNGNGTFSEIGELAGIANTDWSWSGLIADLDNDGFKDIVITNGMSREVNDNDFNEYFVAKQLEGKVDPTQVFQELQKMPVERVDNYVFQNQGEYTFKNKTKEWGLSFPGFSNGAAYADLDNDGDLDLIINNIDEAAMIYENTSDRKKDKNFIQLGFKASGKNVFGIGTKVSLSAGGTLQYQELYPSRGFLSSVAPVLHFGLGDVKTIENISITWPDGTTSSLKDVDINQKLILEQESEELKPYETKQREALLFDDVSAEDLIDYVHKENYFDDYSRQTLLPYKLSHQGPFIAVADVNNDGLEDVFIGGAAKSPGKLFIQGKNSTFVAAEQQPWAANKDQEDIGVLFFDANNDGFPDLYVVSGGNEFEEDSELYQDRLYINDGSGSFKQDQHALPKINSSGSCVVAADFDNDGDLDLFVGGRLTPGKYPLPGKSYIFENQNGKFTDVTSIIAPGLNNIGMVTSAVWSDYNQDGNIDLLIVGDWMPLTIFENQGSRFSKKEMPELDKTSGWWNTIAEANIDRNGIPDYILGNSGTNQKFKASEEDPYHLFATEIDGNNQLAIVLAYKEGDKLVPERGRHAFAEYSPRIKKRFPSYASFGIADVNAVLGEENFLKALHYKAHTFASSYILNPGKSIGIKSLPMEVQFFPVQSIIVEDINNDGLEDYIFTGNMWHTEAETARRDAGIGVLILGSKDGALKVSRNHEIGFFAKGDSRDSKFIEIGTDKYLIIGNNDAALQLYRINRGLQSKEQIAREN